MCDTSHISNKRGKTVWLDPWSFDEVVKAREAADEVLRRYLGVKTEKVLDLSTPKGFDRAIAELSSNLRAAVGETDLAAVRAAAEVLDVNWFDTTPEQRKTLIEQALVAAGRKTAIVPTKVEVVLADQADEIVKATRAHGRRTHGLSIRADLSAVDKRIINHLKVSQSYFVTNEYGLRHEAFGKAASHIVADGLEHGFGRDDIAHRLAMAAETIIPGKGSAYWDVIAGAFTGRGRSLAQLSSYSEAGIERYMIEAVLDERTTDVCRFLHGKVFSVGGGLKLFEQAEQNPEALKQLNPWVRRGRNEDGDPMLYVKAGEDRIEPLAIIERSGVGRRDDRGSFAMARTEREMADLGVGFPPYHGLCRTTVLPAM